MGRRQSLQQMMLGKLDSNIQQNETGPLSYSTHRISSKWMKDLNVRLRGSWVAQSVKQLHLAQVMILGSRDQALCWDPYLVANLLLPLAAAPPLNLSLSLSLSPPLTNKHNLKKKWSSFILLYVVVQFSQHHLLKRYCLFSMGYSFLLCLKIS